MKSHWITHNGKKIFYADYSNMNPEELQVEGASIVSVLSEMPKNSVLSLVDVRGTFGTPDAMNILKGITSKTKFFVSKRAVVGITGVKKILLKGLNQFVGQNSVPFDNVEEALEWLIQN